MAITVAMKEAAVVAAAIAITFPHCYSGITKDISYNRNTIFSSIQVNLFSLKNHSKKSTSTYTPTKTKTVIQLVEK